MPELFLQNLVEEVMPYLGFSRYSYFVPVHLSDYQIYSGSPEHSGPYKNAIDIAVPDPRETETIIYAPQSGIVRAGVLTHTRWGTFPDDKQYLNWLHVSVSDKEFYEIAHIDALPNAILRVGDFVEKGQPIAKAGLNGRITATNGVPDSHVHILVGTWGTQGSFTSLKIRWDHKVDFKTIM